MADLSHSDSSHQQQQETFGIDFNSFDLRDLMNMQQGTASSSREVYGDGRGGFSSQNQYNQQQQPMLQNSPVINTEALKQQLQQQLQQQMRLQQLQQLQNHILQQQIELISGQGNIPKEVLMHGLLTPTSSSELRPIVHTSYPPPISLQQQYTQDPHGMMSSLVSPAMTPINVNNSSTMSTSTPFHNPAHMTPVDMFSPLTSPALEPSIGGNTHNNVPYSHQSYASSRSSLASVSVSPSHQELSLGGSDLSSHSQPSPSIPPRKSSKRTLADDQGSASRKRQSPIIKPTNSGPAGASKRTSARSRRQDSTSELQMAMSTCSAGEIDISMPPPAPPAPPLPPMTMTTNAPSRSPPSASPNMEPVTPGSMLNLGLLAKMPAGLVPQQRSEQNSLFAQQPRFGEGPSTNMDFSPHFQQSNRSPFLEAQQQQQQQQQQLANILTQSLGGQDTQMQQTTIDPKLTRTPVLAATVAGDNAAFGSNSNGSSSAARTPTLAATAPSKKTKAAAASAANSKSQTSAPSLHTEANGRSRSNTTTSRPKAILPSGMSIEAASQLKTNFSPTSANGPASASSSAGDAPPEFKKSTHKQAEQKRRDSLKQGFDDLRFLLPPITIDPDSDEPRLPGSQPPRGPPRNVLPGTEDHPNRGVSKMALLKCSNEYIGKLVKRVGRRDEEIGRLREEVRFLRNVVGVGEEVKGYVVATPSSSQDTESLEYETSKLGGPRMWADLERDLDEIEREEFETKPRSAITVLDAVVATKPPKSSKTVSRDMDEDD